MTDFDRVKFLSYPIVVPQTLETDFGRQPVDRNKFISGIESEANDPSFYHTWMNKLSINHEMRSQYLASHDVEKLSGNWLFLGLQMPHFGHLLAESSHRMWAWEDLKNSVQGVIVLTHPWASNIDQWTTHITELFGLFKIPLDRIVCINHLTEVEGLFVPEQGACLRGKVQTWYNDKLLSLPFLQEVNQNKPIKKLYVSRSNYRHLGRVAGLDALEKKLIKDGYTIVSPETLPVIEQLAMIHNAENIIFEEGSAIHLLEILPRQTGKVFYISRRPNVKNFLILLEQKYDQVFSYENVIVERFSGIRPDCSISYLNSPRKLLQELEDSHFVTSKAAKAKANFLESFFEQERLDNSHYIKKNEMNQNISDECLARYKTMCLLRDNKLFALAKIMFHGVVSFQRLSTQVANIIDAKYSDSLPQEHKQRIAKCLFALADNQNNSYVDDERIKMKEWARELELTD